MAFTLASFSFASADKLDNAVSWMSQNGLTTSTTTAKFKPNNWLRRDEAAKFFVQFAKILWKTDYIRTDAQCTFSDINSSWSDLKNIIIESCKMGLFKGSKWKFNPQGKLTNAQSITVLIRLIIGPQNEAWVNHRANNYYTKANELGILENISMNNKDSIANRGNVALIIYNSNNLGNKSALTTFSDTEIWVSFSYPSSRWPITKDVETNSWNKYLIILSKDWNTFLAFHNGWTPLARWGFWWDQASAINNTWYISDFCQNKSNCTINTNTNWIQYAKYNEEYGEMWSDTINTRLMYYIFNPNSRYRGIIMSNERISNEPISNLDSIINSLSFL